MESAPSSISTTRIRNPRPSRTTSDLSSPSVSSPTISIQNLSSVLNNPHSTGAASSSSSYWSLWPNATDIAAPIPPPSTPFPEIPLSDFQLYLSLVSEPYSRFADIKNHDISTAASDDSATGGRALVACLREVPSLFFKEDFALEDGATFRSACPFSQDEEENVALQERLTQYLDTVEMHLVREISLRSESFFEAQGQLQGLNGDIVEACGRIGELKEEIRVLTGDLVGAARLVQELNGARGNLVALQQKLTVIMYVSQAVTALKLVSFLVCFEMILFGNKV